MKKILALVLAMLVVCSFAACGKAPEKGNNVEITVVGREDEDTTVAAKLPAEATPAQMLWADFQTKYAEDKDTETLANEVIANEAIPYMCGAMPVEEGFLNGFTEEIHGFTECTQFAPMIGSIPFVGYIFKVDGDVNTFMETLRSTADLRWNICTEADELLCEAIGNTVFFTMAPATFDE